MSRIIKTLVLAATFYCFAVYGQTINNAKVNDLHIPFSENHCYSKGGIGIVNMNLYIVVKSEKNELILERGKRWSGQNADNPELVVVYENKVWQQNKMPNSFDLSKSIIFSFEQDKIRFFDFNKMSGGYYLRIKPNP